MEYKCCIESDKLDNVLSKFNKPYNNINTDNDYCDNCCKHRLNTSYHNYFEYLYDNNENNNKQKHKKDKNSNIKVITDNNKANQPYNGHLTYVISTNGCITPDNNLNKPIYVQTSGNEERFRTQFENSNIYNNLIYGNKTENDIDQRNNVKINNSAKVANKSKNIIRLNNNAQLYNNLEEYKRPKYPSKYN